jgi:hypothetical protein
MRCASHPRPREQCICSRCPWPIAMKSLRIITIRPLPFLSIGRPRIWRNWAFSGATIALLGCGHRWRRWCWRPRELSGREAGAPGSLRAWDFVVFGHGWRTCACRITVLTCSELDRIASGMLDEAAPRLGSAPREGTISDQDA